MTKVGKGKLADVRIERIVRNSPGISLYQLTRKTGWNVGKVDGAVRRLVNAKRLFVVAAERNGRRLSQIFPAEFRPSQTVVVPSRLLRAGNPSWFDAAYVYALDSNTIGISGEPISEWQKLSRFSSKVPLGRGKGHIEVKIPEEFIRFYHLDSHFFTKTISANNILLDVGAPIIESKPYPA